MADQDDGGDDEEDWFERALRERRDGPGDEGTADEETGQTDRESEAALDRTDPTGETPDDSPEGQPERDEGTGSAGGPGEEGDSPFAEAFDESTPGEGIDIDVEDEGGESFGFDLGGETEAETFDDEEFESDIPRIDLGIGGLDEMIQGGVPERTLLVSIGGAGTGKTTFGLQFLNRALVDGERGVYITLEESRDRVIQSAEEKGWDFERFEDEGRLAIIDLDPVEMANSLTSIRNELPRLVESFGASRLVLDSVSLLEMMYDDQATRRTEIYDFARALKAAGVTTMLTSEADTDNPFASRYGIIEYLTDAVFVLRHVRPDDFRETRLAIEIQKIRDANHSRETKPFEITDTGISVYREANIY
ncbi:MAG: KaiC domain-containing protein [Halanaeroarchaeum sp.]